MKKEKSMKMNNAKQKEINMAQGCLQTKLGEIQYTNDDIFY